MIVVQNLAKKVFFESQDGRRAHIIGNSVSGERYRTTMVLLFYFLGKGNINVKIINGCMLTSN